MEPTNALAKNMQALFASSALKYQLFVLWKDCKIVSPTFFCVPASKDRVNRWIKSAFCKPNLLLLPGKHHQ